MRILTASLFAIGLFAFGLVSGQAIASGIASAPSEASSETSSKQSSEGSSNSSSGSSPESKFVENNIQQIQVDTARQGGATVDALAKIYQLPNTEVTQRLQQLMTAQAQNASSHELSQMVVKTLTADELPANKS